MNMKHIMSCLALACLLAGTPAAADRKKPLFVDDLDDGGLVADAIASATNSVATNVANVAIRRDQTTMTTPGVMTDYVASGAVGGVRVRASSHNTDNYTAYAYSGVAVRRNAATDDFLWATNSPNGILRRKDVPYVIRACLDGDGIMRFRLFLTTPEK